MTEERMLKMTVKQADGQKYEMLAPTLDGGKTIAGVIETVLAFRGDFTKMPDHVTVNGEKYIPLISAAKLADEISWLVEDYISLSDIVENDRGHFPGSQEKTSAEQDRARSIQTTIDCMLLR